MFLFGLWNLHAQTSCTDWNGYVDSKNVGGTGGFTLLQGSEELAAQTYHYNGPGKITSVRVHGNYPGTIGGVPLKVSIYHVDASDRPTTSMQSVNATWWWYNNTAGYIDVNFGGGGVFVSDNFAVVVELRTAFPWGNTFAVKYTGNGEGHGADLASIAGTSTGFNWSSAMNNFGRDGDFYLVPKMTHFITSSFESNTICAGTGATVSFTNTSEMTTDSMFNTISLAGYAGSNHKYAWNFGDGSPLVYTTNATHAYAAPGVYTVSLSCVVDGWNNDCSDVFDMDISVGLAVSAGSITNVSCNGGENGSALATGSGGAPTYQYNLNGNSYGSSPNFNGLSAGTYTIGVRDDLGCTATTQFSITEPTPIIFTSAASTNASCGSSDGAILVAASGGVGALQYQLNGGLPQSSGSFTGLAAGTYTITAKDANQCTKTVSVSVEDNGGPTISLATWSSISCHGGNDGTITLMASGGSGALQYSINNGASFQNNGTFTGLSAGTYNIVVKDAAQCTEIRKITLNEPPQLAITTNFYPVACHGGNDGEINVTSAIGGTGAITYSVNGVNYQSGTHFYGLSAGTYTVYAKDVAGCITTQSVTVTEPTALGLMLTHVNATCNGSSTGSITATANGGVGGYSYSIDGSNYQATGNFTELAAGTYTVYAMDDNECVATATTTIGQPSAVTATFTTTNSTCGNANGGTLVTASGGSGSGYQYSLNGGTFTTSGNFTNLTSGTYYVRVKDGTGCEIMVTITINDSNGPTITSTSHTNVACHGGSDGSLTVNSVSGGTGQLQYSINGINWQTSTTFSGLPAGTYTVTVKDANTCTGIATVTLTEPNAFQILLNVSNVSCNGGSNGSMTITASGGAGTFAYSLNGFTFQASPNFTNLAAGPYTVTVRDAGGCLATSNFVVTEPTQIEMFTGVLDVTCNGANDGSINVSATGGTGVIQYSLDGQNYQLSGAFTGLAGGAYVVYVKDANGCISTTTLTVAEPSPLSVLATLAAVNCAGGNDGVINLMVSGGTGPYNYMWSNGETTEDIFHLAAGTYSVTVADENGCESQSSYTITQPASPLIVNGVVGNASGTTANDGSVDITVSGGDGPYSFSWSNGATTEDLNNVLPGVYVVIVTDAHGCSTSNTYVVGVTVGISNGLGEFHVTLYPNPAAGRTTVASNGDPIQQVMVYDLVGHLLIDLNPDAQKAEINISTLPVGNYVVKVKVDDAVQALRLEVTR